MEKHLSVLNQALNKANQAGVFNLNESVMVAQSLQAVTAGLKMSAKDNPIEQARAEARAKKEAVLRPVEDVKDQTEDTQKGQQ